MVNMIIGISGSRCVGKDTFFNILYTLNHNFKRFAFADALKRDVQPLLKTQFNIDVFHADPVQKEIIRPILISYGHAWRNIDMYHWVKLIHQEIVNEEKCIIPVITDLRYENELLFLRKEYDKKLIHINILREDCIEPTKEEIDNLEYISDKADVYVQWGNNTFTEIHHIVECIYNEHLKKNLK